MDSGINAIIIDDEKNAVDSLHQMIELYCPKINVIGSANDIDTAIDIINTENPDVIFLDINLGRKTGFDLLEQTKNHNFITVIVSAYDNFALKAFDYEVFNYLLKPVAPSKLAECARKIENHFIAYDNYSEIIPKIIIPTENGLKVIKTSEICLIENNLSHSKIFLRDNTVYFSSKNIDYYEKLFQDIKQINFVRSSTESIVNIDYLSNIHLTNKSIIIDCIGKEITISESAKEKILVYKK